MDKSGIARAGSDTVAGSYEVNGPAGAARDLDFYTANVLRWAVRTNGTAETGSNAGSDFQVQARNDAGASIGNALTITRSTMAAAFANTVTGTDLLTSAGSVTTGVATGYKIARGATAFDGSNPTTVATGLTSVVSCTGTLRLAAQLTTGTAFVTHAAPSGANVDWYAWVIAGTASTGTETFDWVCVGT